MTAKKSKKRRPVSSPEGVTGLNAADALSQFAKAIRANKMGPRELLANLQVMVNALSEHLDVRAIEDVENATTYIVPNPHVRIDDPSYR